ncbi:40S ribosomal protein SA-like protein [Camelus ferus]|nr:40S ribosomal protein SA-like protein [Camelus ferus]
MKDEDVLKFLAAGTHLGGTSLDFQMELYVYERKVGIYIINLKRTWEKLLLVTGAIENPADVSVISSRNTGHQAVQKFAAATRATPLAGHFTPGIIVYQIQAAFREPQLPVVADPTDDQQLLTEASHVNLPSVALCNTDFSSVPCGPCYPIQQQGSPLSGSEVQFLLKNGVPSPPLKTALTAQATEQVGMTTG